MVAVALVGGDGAGKSSIAAELVSLSDGKARYLYMGMNPDSSNFSLPTTKLIFSIKKRKAGAVDGASVSLHSLESRKVERGKLLSAARLVNRVAEETMRQLISWGSQIAGRLVIYDRHFFFDYWHASPGSKPHLSDRLHLWFLRWMYPKPDVVIFLDAPSEVLLERKHEVPAGYLEKRRAAILDAGRHVRRFEVVDASRSFDEVLGDVIEVVEDVRPGLTKTMSRGPR
jgi:thymidylate kinase